MTNAHAFKNLGTLQWGSLSLPWESAKTDYKCERCGVAFTHFYHKEPNIYKAMKDANVVADVCKEVKK